VSIAAATGATIGSGAANNIDTTSVTTGHRFVNTGFTVTASDQVEPTHRNSSQLHDERRPPTISSAIIHPSRPAVTTAAVIPMRTRHHSAATGFTLVETLGVCSYLDYLRPWPGWLSLASTVPARQTGDCRGTGHQPSPADYLLRVSGAATAWNGAGNDERQV